MKRSEEGTAGTLLEEEEDLRSSGQVEGLAFAEKVAVHID